MLGMGQGPIQFRKEPIMKSIRVIAVTLLTFLALATPALAAPASKGYKVGVIALVFYGFSTFVIVTQLIPAIVTLHDIIKRLLKRDTVPR